MPVGGHRDCRGERQKSRNRRPENDKKSPLPFQSSATLEIGIAIVVTVYNFPSPQLFSLPGLGKQTIEDARSNDLVPLALLFQHSYCSGPSSSLYSPRLLALSPLSVLSLFLAQIRLALKALERFLPVLLR